MDDGYYQLILESSDYNLVRMKYLWYSVNFHIFSLTPSFVCFVVCVSSNILAFLCFFQLLTNCLTM